MDDGSGDFAFEEEAEGGGELGLGVDSDLGEELGDGGQDVVRLHGPARTGVVDGEVEGGLAGLVAEILPGKTVMSGFQAGHRDPIGVADHGDAAEEPLDSELVKGIPLLDHWLGFFQNGKGPMGLTRTGECMGQAVYRRTGYIPIFLHRIESLPEGKRGF